MKNSFHCTCCNSSLVLKYLNEKKQMLICSNKNVKYLYNLFSVYSLLILKKYKNLFLKKET